MHVIVLFVPLWFVLCACGAQDSGRTPPLGNSDVPITISTYNIHHWEGTDGRKDISRIAGVIDSLRSDIVLVQETDNKVIGDNRSGRMERVADLLNGNWVTFDSDDPYTVHRNGIFVSHGIKVLETSHTNISEPGRDPRSFVEAVVEIHGIRVRVIGAHLGLKLWERKRQISAIADALEVDKNVHGTVLGGDLNEWNPLARTFRPLKKHLYESPSSRTFPATTPFFRLDRIWVSAQGTVKNSDVLESGDALLASDHLPLRTEIVF